MYDFLEKSLGKSEYFKVLNTNSDPSMLGGDLEADLSHLKTKWSQVSMNARQLYLRYQQAFEIWKEFQGTFLAFGFDTINFCLV